MGMKNIPNLDLRLIKIKTPVLLERKEVAPYPKGYIIFLFVNSTLQLPRCAFFKDNP